MEADESRNFVAVDVNPESGDSNNQPDHFDLNRDSSNQRIDRKLYRRAEEGHFEAFRDKENLKLLVTRFDENTILHIHVTARYRSIKAKESVDFVKNVLAKCDELLCYPNKKGETVLHIAARYGHVDIVEVLLTEDKAHCNTEGADKHRLLGMKNKAGDTALHEAVYYNHIEVVKILMKEGSDHPYGRNNDGETPLYIAAEKGLSKVVSEMCAACVLPAYQGPDDRTALHAAVLRNDKKMAELILGKFKSLGITRKADKLGRTPLHYAAKQGYLPIVKLLLENDIDAAYIVDKKEKSALHVAASHGKVAVIGELIYFCPDCFEQTDKNGRNVLHFAIAADNSSFIVPHIICHKSFGYLINAKDKFGNTPLHQLALCNSTLAADLLFHPQLNTQVFNKKNLSPLDIFSAQDEPPWLSTIMEMALVMFGNRRSLRITEENEGKETGERKNEDGMEKGELVGKRMGTTLKGSKETKPVLDYLKQINLVVAALIATVTFAAGFTNPGGYVSDKKDPNPGSAILIRKPAFKVFVFSNTIAMVLSSSVVFLHLSRRLYRRSGTSIDYIMSVIGTVLAMIAMVVAFVSGTCAVLAPSPLLVTAICVLSASLFFFIFYCQHLTRSLFRCLILYMKWHASKMV